MKTEKEIKERVKEFNEINPNLKSYRWRTLVNNCVKPEVRLHIFNCAFKTKQETITNLWSAQ
jgi:hypothetical protein